MAIIKVMLVDDSPLFLAAMQKAVEEDPRMAVVGTAHDGQAALDRVPLVDPDVIVCDVQMPRMSGIDFLKTLLPSHKIPVLVISSSPDATLSALACGAVDFITKPAAGEASAAFFNRLLSGIRVAALANMGAKTAAHAPVPHAPAVSLHHAPPDVVVAIGASTGGTDAILEVVRHLPANFPATLITQHMPAGFTAMYAQRMDRECKMQVREVRDGDRVEQGLILLAAGDYHLRLKKDARGFYASSQTGAKVSGHMPSVDVLFQSVAETAGKRAVGILLTGMGSDGAEGLLQMRQAGAYTIGQNQATSVVYGMPMVAFNKGAVVKQLGLSEIAAHLIAQVARM